MPEAPSDSIFPAYSASPLGPGPAATAAQPPPGPPMPPPAGENTLELSAADLVPELRWERTLISISATYSMAMLARNQMSGQLAEVTKLPRSVITLIRGGQASQVTVESLCLLADALGCSLDLRLTPLTPTPRPQ